MTNNEQFVFRPLSWFEFKVLLCDTKRCVRRISMVVNGFVFFGSLQPLLIMTYTNYLI